MAAFLRGGRSQPRPSDANGHRTLPALLPAKLLIRLIDCPRRDGSGGSAPGERREGGSAVGSPCFPLKTLRSWGFRGVTQRCS